MLIAKAKQKLRERKGDGSNLMTIALAIFIIGTGVFLCDYMRAFSMQEEISYELYRGINIAMKDAMLDSYRIDSESIYEEAVVEKSFTEYLQTDMGFSKRGNTYTKIDGNDTKTLTLEDFSTSYSNKNPQAEAKLNLQIDSWFFKKAGMKWDLPIRIKTKNQRTEEGY